MFQVNEYKIVFKRRWHQPRMRNGDPVYSWGEKTVSNSARYGFQNWKFPATQVLPISIRMTKLTRSQARRLLCLVMGIKLAEPRGKSKGVTHGDVNGRKRNDTLRQS